LTSNQRRAKPPTLRDLPAFLILKPDFDMACVPAADVRRHQFDVVAIGVLVNPDQIDCNARAPP
jgi:hypothetical protein